MTTTPLGQKFIDTVASQPGREIQLCIKGAPPMTGKVQVEQFHRTSDVEPVPICTILCEAQIGSSAPVRLPFTFDPGDLLWFSTGPIEQQGKGLLWGS